ncbi:MAG TPA: hypothetical protein VLT33_01155 [Labilithrix sp.]|nr:hypothetical protein [Labilithrix sp.]
MRGWLSAAGALVALSSLAACRRPTCRGELSRSDVQALQARGQGACEELTRATVRVDDEGFLLDGARVHAIFPPGKKVGVAPLDALLVPARDNWKAVHPGQEFVGVVDLEIPSETDVGPGVSVASALAQAGYRRMNVRSGDVTAQLDWWLRSGADTERRELVHVESDPRTRGFVVRFAGEATPRTGRRHDVADRADAAKAIAAEWAETPGPFPRALVVRVPNGTFHDALALAGSFRSLPELAAARIAIEIGAPSR